MTDTGASLVTEAGHPGEPGLLVERLLRQPEDIWRQIAAEHELRRLNGQLVLASALPLAIYGAVLGSSNSVLQAVASAVKLPVLFLLTLAICLPALYLFNLVFGSRLSAAQTLALVLSAIATTGMLTLGFAPISVFFLLSAPDYDFFKLLNVAILTLTGFAGLRSLLKGMARVQPQRAPSTGATGIEASQSDARGGQLMLRAWLLVYAFVGTQLAWTLRPFFGAPELPFELFRRLEGNFYVNILQAVFG